MKRIPVLLVLTVLGSWVFGQAASDPQVPPRIQDRVAAAREAAQRLAEEAAAKAGNPLAPQPVDESEVISHERLSNRFRVTADQLKPAFFQHMQETPELAPLARAGCVAEKTLPVGTEYEPGHLDGTATLFKCEDGAYGLLEIGRPYLHPSIARWVAPQAFNDSVGTTPAVGRYRRTPSGVTMSMVKWQTGKGKVLTISLTEPGQGASEAAADERVKRLAVGVDAAD